MLPLIVIDVGFASRAGLSSTVTTSSDLTDTSSPASFNPATTAVTVAVPAFLPCTAPVSGLTYNTSSSLEE